MAPTNYSHDVVKEITQKNSKCHVFVSVHVRLKPCRLCVCNTHPVGGYLEPQNGGSGYMRERLMSFDINDSSNNNNNNIITTTTTLSFSTHTMPPSIGINPNSKLQQKTSNPSIDIRVAANIYPNTHT